MRSDASGASARETHDERAPIRLPLVHADRRDKGLDEWARRNAGDPYQDAVRDGGDGLRNAVGERNRARLHLAHEVVRHQLNATAPHLLLREFDAVLRETAEDVGETLNDFDGALVRDFGVRLLGILRQEVLQLPRVLYPRGAAADDAEGQEALDLLLRLARNAGGECATAKMLGGASQIVSTIRVTCNGR